VVSRAASARAGLLGCSFRKQRGLDLAREHGFEKVRTLSRMSLAGVADAPRLDNHDELVFAAAGFEYG